MADEKQFSALTLTKENIETIAKLNGVYLFISKSTASGACYVLSVGRTSNLYITSKAFFDFIQTTQIKDEELIVSFYKSDNVGECESLVGEYTTKYKNSLPDLSFLGLDNS